MTSDYDVAPVHVRRADNRFLTWKNFAKVSALVGVTSSTDLGTGPFSSPHRTRAIGLRPNFRMYARQREPTERPQTNYLVETSAMKRRSIQLRHPATSTRIRSGIAFLSVCVLVGLVAFFAGAYAQVATPNAAATTTPAPTATPFATF